VANSNDSLLRRWAAFRREVRRELIDFRPDVVVAHFALYVWPALRWLRDHPLVVQFHGPWYAEARTQGAGRLSTWARFRMERAVYRRANRLVTLSGAFKELLIRDFGVDESRIAVVRGGVDLVKFDIPQTVDEARQQLGWPRNRPIVLSVRRLVRRMGLENLIDASRAVRDKAPDALILIAGVGPLQTELQERIDGASLHDHVRLLGYLPEAQLPLAYRAANITVVPSVALEGFGLVAAESLAAGTPAVVTNVGGLPEVVKPLRASLVALDCGSDALAETIIAALKGTSHPPGSAECRQYAGQFDWSLVAKDIRREVYEVAIKASVRV
jgi:glycosyltransferase involved in cell wall biosynthesis